MIFIDAEDRRRGKIVKIVVGVWQSLQSNKVHSSSNPIRGTSCGSSAVTYQILSSKPSVSSTKHSSSLDLSQRTTNQAANFLCGLITESLFVEDVCNIISYYKIKTYINTRSSCAIHRNFLILLRFNYRACRAANGFSGLSAVIIIVRPDLQSQERQGSLRVFGNIEPAANYAHRQRCFFEVLSIGSPGAHLVLQINFSSRRRQRMAETNRVKISKVIDVQKIRQFCRAEVISMTCVHLTYLIDQFRLAKRGCRRRQLRNNRRQHEPTL